MVQMLDSRVSGSISQSRPTKPQVSIRIQDRLMFFGWREKGGSNRGLGFSLEMAPILLLEYPIPPRPRPKRNRTNALNAIKHVGQLKT